MFMGTVVTNEKNEDQQIGISDEQKFDISKSLETIFKSPLGIITAVKDQLDNFKPTTYITATKSLNEEAYRLARSLGVSSQRTRELTVAVADAIPEFVGIGLEVGDAGKAMSTLYESLNTNLFIGKEALTEFAATSKVTGVEQKTLAVNFRDVGVSIANIGPKMREVTRIAQQAGVTVKAVSDAVVSNLDKMNLYNFEGGIKGLAKMAAQASRLGISMEGVFNVVDKVFNPEGAINMAAALQRLGVTTSDLLDPLRLMDLSQNDPTELQNQMVNMTKEFVRFNKESKSFEILPGAKRRLNEIGTAMGYNNGELQKMAINAANFDAKLKQIRMPNIPINEETRNLIATMAQMNENGIAEVRIAQVDAQGNLTGEYETRAVSELTQQQIERLQKQQLSEGETMSDIARDQLDELRKLNTRINEFIMAQRYGTASSTLFSGTYVKNLRTMTDAFEKSPAGTEPARNSETYRQSMDLLTNTKSVAQVLKDLAKQMTGMITGMGTGPLVDLGKFFIKAGKETYKQYTTPLTNKDFYKDLYSQNDIKSNVEHSGTIKNVIDVNINVDDITSLPKFTQDLLTEGIKKMTTNTEYQESFKKAKENVFNKTIEPINVLEDL